MANFDVSENAAPPARRKSAGGWIVFWLLILGLLAFGLWKLDQQWQLQRQTSLPVAATDTSAIGDPGAAIIALRREQHDLAQRMSDTTSGEQVLRDEVLGVGERAALLEQSVARISSPHAQGEQALRLDETELLLTIGEQQLELSSDVASALHAYALADATLAGSSDPSALNLRQSIAQEVASLRALPPDPRAGIAGQIDALEATLDTPPFVASATGNQPRGSVFDRVVGSMVEVHRSSSQDLLDPSSRDAALTAARLELTLARLALERRDAQAFHAALTRVGRWLPRLFAPDTVERQRHLLADLQRAPLKIDLPTLGGTLAELRRLRQEQPEPAASAAAASSASPASTDAAPATTPDAASKAGSRQP